MAETQDRPTYQYEPLPEADHIRVLDLGPATDRHAPLCGKLRTVQLNHDDYPYEAISYTWGEPVFSHMLHLAVANAHDEPRVLRITSNLAELLQQMRYPLHTRTFWIDAICINQLDSKEKNNQIPLMKFIYRRAFQVNIWLGYHPEEEAMLNLLNIFTRKRTPSRGSSNTETEAAREALCGVLRLPWFTRRWIVQEAVVNPDVTVFCGAETMSLIRLFNLVHQLDSESNPLFKPVRTMKMLWEKLACGTAPSAKEKTRQGSRIHENIRDGFPTHEKLCPMAELMEQFDHFDCADPRDRIYALSSLQLCASISPDYDKTTEEVYIDFAVTMCFHGEWRWILNMASDHHNGSISSGLPSWVPDWRSRPLRESMNTLLPSWDPDWKQGHLLMSMNTQLLHNTSVVNSERPESEERTNTLEIRSPVRYIPLEFISAVISSKGDPFPSDPKKEDVLEWIKHVPKFLSDSCSSSEFTYSESIQETLLNGIFDPFFAFLVAEAFPKPWRELIWSISCGDQNDTTYLEQIARVMRGRCIFVCVNKYFVFLGIGPSHLQIGDQLLQEDDVSRCFVVRKSESTGVKQRVFQTPACPSYELVGDCAGTIYRGPLCGMLSRLAPSNMIILK